MEEKSEHTIYLCIEVTILDIFSLRINACSDWNILIWYVVYMSI